MYSRFTHSGKEPNHALTRPTPAYFLFVRRARLAHRRNQCLFAVTHGALHPGLSHALCYLPLRYLSARCRYVIDRVTSRDGARRILDRFYQFSVLQTVTIEILSHAVAGRVVEIRHVQRDHGISPLLRARGCTADICPHA